jgi:hypothetical protein
VLDDHVTLRLKSMAGALTACFTKHIMNKNTNEVKIVVVDSVSNRLWVHVCTVPNHSRHGFGQSLTSCTAASIHQRLHHPNWFAVVASDRIVGGIAVPSVDKCIPGKGQ